MASCSAFSEQSGGSGEPFTTCLAGIRRVSDALVARRGLAQTSTGELGTCISRTHPTTSWSCSAHDVMQLTPKHERNALFSSSLSWAAKTLEGCRRKPYSRDRDRHQAKPLHCSPSVEKFESFSADAPAILSNTVHEPQPFGISSDAFRNATPRPTIRFQPPGAPKRRSCQSSFIVPCSGHVCDARPIMSTKELLAKVANGPPQLVASG